MAHSERKHTVEVPPLPTGLCSAATACRLLVPQQCQRQWHRSRNPLKRRSGTHGAHPSSAPLLRQLQKRCNKFRMRWPPQGWRQPRRLRLPKPQPQQCSPLSQNKNRLRHWRRNGNDKDCKSRSNRKKSKLNSNSSKIKLPQQQQQQRQVRRRHHSR